MEIVDYLLARKKAGGGGSEVTIEQLNVTENGTYSEQGIAYSPVVVNVPAPENSYQLTDLPTGAVASITDGTALPMPSLKVGIEPVQSGSGDPSPENIRPISGWTAANVTRTGKNLYFDKLENASISAIGTLEINTSNDMFIARVNEGETYTFTLNDTGVTVGGFFVEKPTMSSVSYNNARIYLSSASQYSYTIPQGVKYIAVRYLKTFTTPVIEKGTTITTYEPYTGQTYNIEFTDGDNPLTVYGGTLDVTTGELVVNRVYKEFDGTENWARYATSENNTSFNLYSSISNATSYNGQISNQLNFNMQAYDVASDRKYTFAVEPTNGRRVFIQVPTSVASTNETFKTWLATQKANNTPVAISVKITPTTYHLTPTQVRTLVGNNNIWADTGDIIEGKYFKEL